MFKTLIPKVARFGYVSNRAHVNAFPICNDSFPTQDPLLPSLRCWLSMAQAVNSLQNEYESVLSSFNPMQVITRVGANLDKKNEIKEILSIFFFKCVQNGRMPEWQSRHCFQEFKALDLQIYKQRLPLTFPSHHLEIENIYKEPIDCFYQVNKQ